MQRQKDARFDARGTSSLVGLEDQERKYEYKHSPSERLCYTNTWVKLRKKGSSPPFYMYFTVHMDAVVKAAILKFSMIMCILSRMGSLDLRTLWQAMSMTRTKLMKLDIRGYSQKPGNRWKIQYHPCWAPVRAPICCWNAAAPRSKILGMGGAASCCRLRPEQRSDKTDK